MEEIGEKTPKISIIILSYQKYDGLYRTLDTILSQNYRNIEILISDDGSEQFPESEIMIWAKKHARGVYQISSTRRRILFFECTGEIGERGQKEKCAYPHISIPCVF